MADKIEEKVKLFQRAPIIVSEMRVDFNEVIKMNQNIVNLVLKANVDILTKAGMLERLLPGLMVAGDCACSCSCSCSCTCGSESLQGSITPQAGRVF
jgi:hypothetical protein